MMAQNRQNIDVYRSLIFALFLASSMALVFGCGEAPVDAESDVGMDEDIAEDVEPDIPEPEPVTTDLSPGWHHIENTAARRTRHTAIRAGNKMIVWGGWGGDFYNTGQVYDPHAENFFSVWGPTNTLRAIEPRAYHTAIWTGDEMIVWGGMNGENETVKLADGGRYSHETRNWQELAPSPLSGRAIHAAIWTGDEMIIWGGVLQNDEYATDGAAYDPQSDSWRTIDAPDGYTGREVYKTTVWTGEEMILWGGRLLNGVPASDGWRYDPTNDEWTEIAVPPEPINFRAAHTSIWTGEEIIIWGGYYASGSYARETSRILSYNPTTDSWRIIPRDSITASGRNYPSGVWTGEEAIFFGGITDRAQNRGIRINPATGVSQSLADSNRPTARVAHSAVWLGAKMAVTGGDDRDGFALSSTYVYVP